MRMTMIWAGDETGKITEGTQRDRRGQLFCTFFSCFSRSLQRQGNDRQGNKTLAGTKGVFRKSPQKANESSQIKVNQGSFLTTKNAKSAEKRKGAGKRKPVAPDWIRLNQTEADCTKRGWYGQRARPGRRPAGRNGETLPIRATTLFYL